MFSHILFLREVVVNTSKTCKAYWDEEGEIPADRMDFFKNVLTPQTGKSTGICFAGSPEDGGCF